MLVRFLKEQIKRAENCEVKRYGHTPRLVALVLGGCSSGGGSEANDSMVAATVNGRNIMLADVERAISAQAGGKQAQLSSLELAQARLQVLSSLMQREVLFQRAEREKLLPTDDQITATINQQKQQSV